MVNAELSSLPLTNKRYRTDSLIVSGAAQSKKAKLLTKDDAPPKGTGVEIAAVAKALLQLKCNTPSPMVKWVKLFDESSSDEENSHEDENAIVKALVKAAFSKKHRRTMPAVSSLVGASEQIQPDDFLRNLLASHGKAVKYIPASCLSSFFSKVTDDYVQGYSMDVVKAVRADDVVTLRRLQREGHTMLCGTKFGDSIVHLACRRSCVKVLDFLLNEVGITCRLACDFGRTPLHDSMWTSKPNWEILTMLLNACPDLLYITDKRGSTPLSYIPKAHWSDICHFLEQRDASCLVAREIQ